jgi:hypothetical protein
VLSFVSSIFDLKRVCVCVCVCPFLSLAPSPSPPPPHPLSWSMCLCVFICVYILVCVEPRVMAQSLRSLMEKHSKHQRHRSLTHNPPPSTVRYTRARAHTHTRHRSRMHNTPPPTLLSVYTFCVYECMYTHSHKPTHTHTHSLTGGANWRQERRKQQELRDDAARKHGRTLVRENVD